MRHAVNIRRAKASEMDAVTSADEIYTESRPVTVTILEKMGAKVSGETFPFFKGVCTPIDISKEDYEKA